MPKDITIAGISGNLFILLGFQHTLDKQHFLDDTQYHRVIC